MHPITADGNTATRQHATTTKIAQEVATYLGMNVEPTVKHLVPLGFKLL